MNLEKYIKNLGAPDIKVSGFQIWIHSREYPQSRDFWDSNWLNVTAHCGANNASVWVNGSILRNTEIADWLHSLEEMNKTILGEANLDTIEANLKVKLRMEQLGEISMDVEITPDSLTQRHYFGFKIDQSYLKELIRDCHKVLSKFPIKEIPENNT